MIEAIILASGIVIIVALVLGVIIGVAAKVFEVEIDPRIEDVSELLPGANCGGCGFAGCSDFAKAVVEGKVECGSCPVCSEAQVAKIATALGLEQSEKKEKIVAIVLCGGDNTVAKPAANYNGVNDCKSASLVAGGAKGCQYGCLGLGTCARACPFNAIEVVNGLALIHPDLCVGCGKCVDTCPRHIIKLVPESVKPHVFCNSPEKGPAKKIVCSVSCIGCRKCVKAAEEGQMVINGFLASVNYENAPSVDIIEKAACPTGCLRTSEENMKQVKSKKEAA